jgi:hypothetical protein
MFRLSLIISHPKWPLFPLLQMADFKKLNLDAWKIMTVPTREMEIL